jgi:AmmeMemoRadiSam system protein B
VYAGLYHAVLDQKVDRVLLLGNNQFGFGDGVVGTRLGFQSPMGRLECDTEFVDALVERLGDEFVTDQIDHVASHCIEMQIPWIQRCLGSPRVVGVLLPDPLEPAIDDEPRVTADAFVAAVREVIASSQGRTLVIAAGDLSHIGPQFGEPRPIDEQRKAEADRTDRELIATFAKGDPDAFLSAVKWNANANRWSGVGAMLALLGIVQPTAVEMIDYHQHPLDDQHRAMVASVGLALGA